MLLLDATNENLPLIRGQSAVLARLLGNLGVPVQLEYAPGGHTSTLLYSQEPLLDNFLEAGWSPSAG